MLKHSLITEQSRKAKAARSLYDSLRSKVSPELWLMATEWDSVHARDGIPVPAADTHRVLNLRIHDEHLSPYMKTDMNLFQMLMLDDTVRVVVYRAQHGWLFVYDGVAEGPKPFGQNGFDTR